MIEIKIIAATLVLLLGAVPGTPPQAVPTPASATCDSIQAYHRIDFWIGTWDVYGTDGARAGRDRVSKILKGCAVTEDWSGADGSSGLGVIYYNVVTNQWSKLYLTDQGNLRGGVKERVMVGEYANGGVRFQGTIPGPVGKARLMNRTTITPRPDGRIHYLIENSVDGGDTWQASFDVFYVRATGS